MALPTITSNSPSSGYIAWTAFSIQYNGVSYTVAAGNTNKKFTCWRYNGAPTLEFSDTLPNDLTADDLLLFLNKSGIGVLAPTASVIDGSLIVAGSILADAIAANQIQAFHIDAGAVTANAIAAGAVTTDALAAGAITASKLSIGAVSDNMVVNGSFEDGVQGWGLGTPTNTETAGTADIVTGVASSGQYALRITRTSGTTTVTQAAEAAIPVTGSVSRSWYVSVTAGAGASLTSAFALRVYWMNADKTTVVSTTTVTSGQALSTTWKRLEGTVTPPSAAKYMRIGLVNSVTTSGTAIYIDSVEAMEVTVAAQIANGAITTPKLSANAVTANVIAANAVTAAKVLADEALLGKLLVRQLTAAEIDVPGIITSDELKTSGFDGGTGLRINDAGLQTIAETGQVSVSGTGIAAGLPGGDANVTITPDGTLTATGAEITGSEFTVAGDVADPWVTALDTGFEDSSEITEWTGGTGIADPTASSTANTGSVSMQMGTTLSNGGDSAARAIRTITTPSGLGSGGRRVHVAFALNIPVGFWSIGNAAVAVTVLNTTTVMTSASLGGATGWVDIDLTTWVSGLGATFPFTIAASLSGVSASSAGNLLPKLVDDVLVQVAQITIGMTIGVHDNIPGARWYDSEGTTIGRVSVPGTGQAGIWLDNGLTDGDLARVGCIPDSVIVEQRAAGIQNPVGRLLFGRDGNAVILATGDLGITSGSRITLTAPEVKLAGRNVPALAPDPVDLILGTWPTNGAGVTPIIYASSSVRNTATDTSQPIIFPGAFPHGVMSVVATNGDSNAQPDGHVVVHNIGLTGFYSSLRGGVNGLYRVNWIAMGW